MQTADRTALLDVSDLSVAFRNGKESVQILDGVGFKVRPGEVLALVGESGSGKTVASLAVMQLIQRQGGRVTDGTILYEGRDVVGMSRAEVDQLRGAELAMIFQQPTRSLNPAFTVGRQISDVVRRHTSRRKDEIWERAVEMLDLVGIPDPERRAHDYPHQFSGGQCQRIMIAMALACDPKLLIADEPTTALDVTVQAQILDLLRHLRDTLGLAVMIITHDLGVVASIADRVAVMYAGQVVEVAGVDELFRRPRHPYTAALLAAIPTFADRGGDFTSIPGRVALPGEWPQGCRFAPRCEYAEDRCTTAMPPLTGGDHRDRCVRSDELELAGVEVHA